MQINHIESLWILNYTFVYLIYILCKPIKEQYKTQVDFKDHKEIMIYSGGIENSYQ